LLSSAARCSSSLTICRISSAVIGGAGSGWNTGHDGAGWVGGSGWNVDHETMRVRAQPFAMQSGLEQQQTNITASSGKRWTQAAHVASAVGRSSLRA
jgi:hypothetical protein